MGKGESGALIHMEANSSTTDALAPKMLDIEEKSISKAVPATDGPVDAGAEADSLANPAKFQPAEPSACFDNPVYENGGPKANGVVENGTVAGNAEPEKTGEEIDKRRLYFVRMPRPPEGLSAVPGLEQELEALRTQGKLLDVNLNLKKTERTRARERVAAAREDYAKSKAQLDAIDDKLRPLTEMRKKRRAEQDGLKNAYADLDVRTEAELQDKLKFLLNKLQHETNSLTEEKQLLKQIKRLEGLGDRVREYQEKAAAVATAKDDVAKYQDDVKALEAERKTAFEDFQLQKTVWIKLKEEEAGFEAEVTAIMDDRRRLKAMGDNVYNKMAAMKREQRAKDDLYWSNRRFSKSVRELCKAGKVDEARAECEKQMSEMNEKLATDEAFRTQYIALWETQRPYSVYTPASDFECDEPPTVNDVSARVQGMDASGKRGRVPPSQEAKAKAEAVIAAALSAVKVEPPLPMEKEAAGNGAADLGAAHKPAEGTVAENEVEKGAVEKAKPMKPAKKEKPKPVVVAPVIIDDTPFTLPDAVVKEAVAEATAEEKREAERKRQAALAKEAELKRERKRKAAEKKLKKAAEKPAVPVAPAAAVEAPQPLAIDAPPAEEDAPPPAKRDVVVRAKSKPAAPLRGPGLAPKKPKKKGFMKMVKQYQLYIIVSIVLLLLGLGAWFFLA